MSADGMLQADTHNTASRRSAAQIWARVFLAATLVGLIALVILFVTILNDTFTWIVTDESGKLVAVWRLTEGIFNRDAMAAVAAEKAPGQPIVFHSWINWNFITGLYSRNPLQTGILPALVGSIGLIAFTALFAFPIGVGAAIYLEEYANPNTWYNRLILINISNLAGVPSIIYGLLGLTVFVRVLVEITNGRSLLSGALTMALLVLPIIIVSSQEAIRAVPKTIRQASYGLGATKWQTIWHHVLPNSMGGIMTGTILAISRALGETAPLIVVGVGTLFFVTLDPLERFSALPYQIYGWTASSQTGFRNAASAGIVVLLIILLSANAVAVYMRSRMQRGK